MVWKKNTIYSWGRWLAVLNFKSILPVDFRLYIPSHEIFSQCWWDSHCMTVWPYCFLHSHHISKFDCWMLISSSYHHYCHLCYLYISWISKNRWIVGDRFGKIPWPIGSMYGIYIYANIGGILMGFMLPYIPYMEHMGDIPMIFPSSPPSKSRVPGWRSRRLLGAARSAAAARDALGGGTHETWCGAPGVVHGGLWDLYGFMMAMYWGW